MTLPIENVQTYPRPPLLEPVPHMVTVRLGGVEIVRTTRALRVCETHHAPTYYIPFADIRAERSEAAGGSFCEWKGRARYWTLPCSAGWRPSAAAGTTPSPTPRFAGLVDHMAIYAQAMEACTVGGLPVTPQPGDFYGGWVMPNLEGIVKGGPGTMGW